MRCVRQTGMTPPRLSPGSLVRLAATATVGAALLTVAACGGSSGAADQTFLSEVTLRSGGTAASAAAEQQASLITAGHAVCTHWEHPEAPIINQPPAVYQLTSPVDIAGAAGDAYCREVATLAMQRLRADIGNEVRDASAAASALAAATPSTPTTAPAAPRTSTPRATPKATVSCAKTAMAAGKFDPTCSEYQGYLDPGKDSGRQPSSGQSQQQYGCEQGYIPKDQC